VNDGGYGGRFLSWVKFGTGIHGHEWFNSILVALFSKKCQIFERPTSSGIQICFPRHPFEQHPVVFMRRVLPFLRVSLKRDSPMLIFSCTW